MSRSSAPIVILGGGSHGRVLLASLLATGRTVLGFIDSRKTRGSGVDGYLVLGGDEAIDEHDAEVAIGLGLLPARRRVFDQLATRRRVIADVMHPSVIVNGPLTRGHGCQVLAGVVLQPGVVLGDNVMVNTSASVDHECVLEAHAVIGPGAVICGNVTIGEAATVGPGATITRGLRIGAGSVVAAGAVVVDDVPDGASVFGVPAKVKTP